LEILNERDWDAHFELIAEDCEWEDVPAGLTIRGPGALVEETKSFVAAFPDIHVDLLRVIAQGDLVRDRVAGSGNAYRKADRAGAGWCINRRAARSCEMEWESRGSTTAKWCHTETTSTACKCTSRSDGDRARVADPFAHITSQSCRADTKGEAAGNRTSQPALWPALPLMSR
jgi:SnoaL-like domain